MSRRRLILEQYQISNLFLINKRVYKNISHNCFLHNMTVRYLFRQHVYVLLYHATLFYF